MAFTWRGKHSGYRRRTQTLVVQASLFMLISGQNDQGEGHDLAYCPCTCYSRRTIRSINVQWHYACCCRCSCSFAELNSQRAIGRLGTELTEPAIEHTLRHDVRASRRWVAPALAHLLCAFQRIRHTVACQRGCRSFGARRQ